MSPATNVFAFSRGLVRAMLYILLFPLTSPIIQMFYDNSCHPSGPSELAFRPTSRMRCHLNRSRSPILPMVVPLVRAPPDACAFQSLVIGERGKHAEDDGNARVELHAHERVRDGLADVLEVHRRALDEHAYRDHGIEGLMGHVDGYRSRRGGA